MWQNDENFLWQKSFTLLTFCSLPVSVLAQWLLSPNCSWWSVFFCVHIVSIFLVALWFSNYLWPIDRLMKFLLARQNITSLRSLGFLKHTMYIIFITFFESLSWFLCNSAADSDEPFESNSFKVKWKFWNVLE